MTAALFVVAGGAAGPFAYTTSVPGQEPSYGELARLTYPVFEEMVADLRRFDEVTLPHEAKVLRRVIGDVWYLLDIFAYAYTTHGDDLLPQLLATLKQGYDRVGDFKDLFDRQLSGGLTPQNAQYDETELASFRDSALDWRRRFLQPERLEAYRAYLRSPSLEKLFMRPKSSLSKCYWGGAAAVPSHQRSGLQNLRALMMALVEKLRREYEEIEKVHTLLEGRNHDAFHDFRVRLRCVLSMVNYFPPLTAGVSGARAIEHRLEDLVAKYGDLNDRIMAYKAADSKGEKTRTEELRKSIASQWSEMRKWQREARIDDALRDYAHRLRLSLRQVK